jgi:hypothetical protein
MNQSRFFSFFQKNIPEKTTVAYSYSSSLRKEKRVLCARRNFFFFQLKNNHLDKQFNGRRESMRAAISFESKEQQKNIFHLFLF